MTFKVDEIVYDSKEQSLGVVFEGEPTEEEQEVVNQMMQAFAELIAREQQRAEEYMALVMGGSEEIH